MANTSAAEQAAQERSPAHLKHYFVSSNQQFDAAKLGMWLFLITEILLFSGMFVAYAVYRVWYPEVFSVASTELNPWLGGLNTVVLLASSLTVALAIHAAQTDKRRALVTNLFITVLLAGVFMVVKYFEYTHKFHLGIFPRRQFCVCGDDGPADRSDLLQHLLCDDRHSRGACAGRYGAYSVGWACGRFGGISTAGTTRPWSFPACTGTLWTSSGYFFFHCFISFSREPARRFALRA